MHLNYRVQNEPLRMAPVLSGVYYFYEDHSNKNIYFKLEIDLEVTHIRPYYSKKADLISTVLRRNVETIKFKTTFRISIRLRVLLYLIYLCVYFQRKEKKREESSKGRITRRTKSEKLKKKEDLDSNGEDELSESGTVSLHHKDMCECALHFIWDTGFVGQFV